MQNRLTKNDHKLLESLISKTEKQTNSQIVLAVVQRCDAYPQVPWKAFSFTISLAMLFFMARELFIPGWTINAPIAQILYAMAIAVFFSLLTVFLPFFARIFLSAQEMETEVRQYAESLFLRKKIYATEKHNGVLIMLSLFERQIIIIPDNAIKEILSDEKSQNIIAVMRPFLRQNKIRLAFEKGLEQYYQLLKSTKVDDNENILPDGIIEEKGI